jgi:hypothetical protein
MTPMEGTHVRVSKLSAVAMTFVMAAMVSAIVVPTPAVAEAGVTILDAPPPGFSSWQQLFAVQNPLNDAGFRIQSIAQAQATSGYSGFALDVFHNSLDLRWKGQPGPVEQATITQVRTLGIKVNLLPAVYSRAELTAMSDLVQRDAVDRGTGERVTRIEPRPDGSGIDVQVRRTSTSAVRAASAIGSSLPNVQRAVAQGGVRVTAGAQPGTPFLREADQPMFWGGALILNDAGACSSGFAVNWPQIGKNYIVTAGHCGAVGSVWRSGSGALLGTAEGTSVDRGYDALFINTTPNGGSEGHIYDGPGIYQPGQFDKLVKGASHVGKNGWICLSGALTGAKCATQVDSNGEITDCDLPPLPCVKVITALGSGNIAGYGDSGGPVFTLSNNYPIAAGTITAAHGTLDYKCKDPLQGHFGFTSATRLCSTGVEFTDLLNAMSKYNGLRITAA